MVQQSFFCGESSNTQDQRNEMMKTTRSEYFHQAWQRFHLLLKKHSQMPEVVVLGRNCPGKDFQGQLSQVEIVWG